ncbi:SDR family oxidoreductase [Halorussus lipolyticus]|uniref:SDR family oxidoreductase n=1 Tax=Halorussus lipolyticus TaxID=3034024 RepID=UPI0023E8AA2B|nr:SDR family oxidoreductase [Halorussus sp. DT80]
MTHNRRRDATDDRTVLITGCGSGIGRATAREFARRGWTVYATDLRTDLLEPLEDECETAELDVTDEAQCEEVVERIADDEGSIDCLVNNAGYGVLGAVADVSTEKAREQFDVLVHGPHRLARAVLPKMHDQHGGTIVNVTSLLGRVTFPGLGVYGSAKFALEGLTDALRMETGPDIDVVAVEPGWVRTGFDDEARQQFADIDASPEYADVYELHEEGPFLDGGPLAVEPEAVADEILHAATATNPKSRYPVGVARWLVLLRFLPDSVQDKGRWAIGKLGTKLRRFGLL